MTTINNNPGGLVPGSAENMTEDDVLLESLQAIKVAAGDILLVEVRETISERQIRSFRRGFSERLERAGFSPDAVVVIVITSNPPGSKRLETSQKANC